MLWKKKVMFWVWSSPKSLLFLFLSVHIILHKAYTFLKLFSFSFSRIFEGGLKKYIPAPLIPFLPYHSSQWCLIILFWSIPWLQHSSVLFLHDFPYEGHLTCINVISHGEVPRSSDGEAGNGWKGSMLILYLSTARLWLKTCTGVL